MILKRPREFKTPPPPVWGEEEDDHWDPLEPFYNPHTDPNQRRFDFIDSEEVRRRREAGRAAKRDYQPLRRKLNKQNAQQQEQSLGAREEQLSWVRQRAGSLPAQGGKGLAREESLPVFPHNQGRLGGERNMQDELLKRHPGIQEWFKVANQTLANQALANERRAGERAEKGEKHASHRTAESPRNTFKAVSQTGETSPFYRSSLAVTQTRRPIRSGGFQYTNLNI